VRYKKGCILFPKFPLITLISSNARAIHACPNQMTIDSLTCKLIEVYVFNLLHPSQKLLHIKACL